VFKLKMSESYSWPVSFGLPIDGGKFDKQTFEVEFKRLGEKRLSELLEKSSQGEFDNKSACKEIVVGWKDVKAEDGTEMPFSSTAFDALLDVTGVPMAIFHAFTKSIRGEKEKN
jgi:hypothetical protein